jgi:hypothetical protein
MASGTSIRVLSRDSVEVPRERERIRGIGQSASDAVGHGATAALLDRPLRYESRLAARDQFAHRQSVLLAVLEAPVRRKLLTDRCGSRRIGQRGDRQHQRQSNRGRVRLDPCRVRVAHGHRDSGRPCAENEGDVKSV